MSNMVRMYKGIDPTDGTMSLFAVKGDRVAPLTYLGDDDACLTQQGFGRFDGWDSNHGDTLILESLDQFELIWEAEDLSDE